MLITASQIQWTTDVTRALMTSKERADKAALKSLKKKQVRGTVTDLGQWSTSLTQKRAIYELCWIVLSLSSWERQLGAVKVCWVQQLPFCSTSDRWKSVWKFHFFLFSFKLLFYIGCGVNSLYFLLITASRVCRLFPIFCVDLGRNMWDSVEWITTWC